MPTVERVEGLRAADSGVVRVDGLDPRRDRGAVRERVGVQSQASGLPDRIRVGEALDLYASFYRDPADWRGLLVRRGNGCPSHWPWSASRRSRCSTS